MRVEELDYDLPPELIAQQPAEPRDHSRLMVIDRAAGTIGHRRFCDLPQYLRPGDVMVANNSRVIPARLFGVKPTGGKVEVLLLEKLATATWKALVGGRNVRHVTFALPGDDVLAALVERPHAGGDESAARVIRFERPIEPLLPDIGHVPLPPYIHESLRDPSRYQTVYADPLGSAAAPTAGLHFTPHLLAELGSAGIAIAHVTLHVGLDTFKPIAEDVVEAHRIHGEWCAVPEATARAVNAATGSVVAVGTTSARTLESAAQNVVDGRVAAFEGVTSIYITPGYRWRAVDALITNFHLPRSTLLAMVGSFMGVDLMWRAYAEAVAERYRFFSFGDAMLIL